MTTKRSCENLTTTIVGTTIFRSGAGGTATSTFNSQRDVAVTSSLPGLMIRLSATAITVAPARRSSSMTADASATLDRQRRSSLNA